MEKQEKEKKFDANKPYKDVTAKIIMKLSQGRIPWRERWCSPLKGKLNFVSRKNYGGVNMMLLEHEGEYLTFKQCSDNGGKVRKGEHSTTIYTRYPRFRNEEDRKEYRRLLKEGKSVDDIPVWWALGSCQVFHLSQTEGIESKIKAPGHKKAGRPVDIADYLIEKYSHKYGVTVSQKPVNACTTDDATRTITVPEKKQFATEEQWYNLVFREMARNASRHKQEGEEKTRKSKVQNELEKEIAASMVITSCGLAIDETRQDTLAECSRWIDEFNRDFRLIVRASSEAQSLAEKILEPIM